ncbi:hypothetical protein SRHO_G00234150 [Serrasalmus rhombeus]
MITTSSKACIFRLQTHQWCFLLCNVVLFHALLFGGDVVEEFLLQSSPAAYTDRSVLELRERARKLDLSETQAQRLTALPYQLRPLPSSPGPPLPHRCPQHPWKCQSEGGSPELVGQSDLRAGRGGPDSVFSGPIPFGGGARGGEGGV